MTKDMEYLLNINGIEIMQDTVATFGSFFLYIITFAATLILAKIIFPIPQNVFRKMLHIVAFTSSIYVVVNGESWIADVITILVFALIVYPALKIAEKWKGYSKLFVEKKPGEICNSLLLLFISQSILVAFTCGFLQKPYILVAA
nr:hypothetical protein [Butyrivibrio sp.]